MNFLKRLFCRHRALHFLRNVYGDEIIQSGKRSVWACTHCNAVVWKDELHEAALRAAGGGV